MVLQVGTNVDSPEETEDALAPTGAVWSVSIRRGIRICAKTDSVDDYEPQLSFNPPLQWWWVQVTANQLTCYL